MNEIQRIRVDALADILQEYEISITTDKIEKISADFALHMEMEREYSYVPSAPQTCSKCAELQSKVKRLEHENSVYNNSVKQRRRAYAVWIQNNEVRYEH